MFLDSDILRHQIQIRQHPDDIELVNFAKQIEIECETLQRVLEPFTETLLNLTKTREVSLSNSVLGHNRAAWEDILLQQKRLDDNIEGEQQRAIDIVEGYRDSLARREEQVRFMIIRHYDVYICVYTLSIYTIAFCNIVLRNVFVKNSSEEECFHLSQSF